MAGEVKRSEAVTVDAAMGWEMPSESKNYGTMAMAPQFLAPCR
jgi:hypothetical protein